MNIVLVSVLVIILFFVVVRRLAHQRELKGRYNRFIGLKNETNNPREAIAWLSYKLLGKQSIFNNNHRFKFTLDDLNITHEQFREMQTICLRLWWKQLNLRMPTIKEACNGAGYLNEEVKLLTQWMEVLELTTEDLKVDVQSIKDGYIMRCCIVLEEGLYHYPDRAWHDWPAPVLANKLLEYWVNPKQERIEKWNEWVLVAKKRHAHRLLTRLREGRYIFPKSDDRVTRLLVYLDKAGATLEDIGTDEDELDQLRGFMYRSKKKTNVVFTTNRGADSN